MKTSLRRSARTVSIAGACGGLLLLACHSLSPESGSGKATAEQRAPEPDTPPADDSKLPAPTNGPVQIVMSDCRRAGCKLLFTFSRAMVKEGELKTAPLPAVSFAPEQQGTLRWLSPRQLEFAPASRSLVWGHEVTITIAKAVPAGGQAFAMKKAWKNTLRVPYFEAAGKVARWPVIPGRPRLVALLVGSEVLRSKYGAAIGAGPATLLYDQPVDPRRVAKSVRISMKNKPLAISVRRPKDAAYMYEGAVDTRLLVAVKLAKLPKHGSSISMQYPQLLDGKVPKIGTMPLTVRTKFELKSVKLSGSKNKGIGPRVPVNPLIMLELSAPTGPGALAKAIQIHPKPKARSISNWGSEAQIQLELEPGKRYQLRVLSSLTDNLGNQLGKGKTLALRAHDLPARVQVPAAPIMLERGQARLPVRGINLGRVTATAYRFDSLASFLQARGAAKKRCDQHAGTSKGMALASISMGTALNEMVTKHVRIGAKKIGLACVQVSSQGRGSRSDKNNITDAILTQITGLGVTTKVHASGVVVWVTRLADAKPRAGAAVTLADATGKIYARGKTDQHGLVTLRAAALTGRGGLKKAMLVTAAAAGDVAVSGVSPKQLSQPWQFGLAGDVADAAALSAVLFTDRGVYRPKEQVHIKLYTDGSRRAEKVQVTLHDPQGKQVLSRALGVDRFGGADITLPLGANAAVGSYTLRAKRGDEQTTRRFQVEEYRVPTFEVKVSSAKGPWRRGGDVSATIAATYLHGGELSARKVDYSVSRVVSPFAPARFRQFVFRAPDRAAPVGSLRSAQTKLDGTGRLQVAFQTEHPAWAGPMRYTVEASVTDVDRQTYAGRLSRVVHPADLYVGVRPPPRDVIAAGTTLRVPVVAVTHRGSPVVGRNVRVELQRIDHHNIARVGKSGAVQQQSHPVSTTVARCAVRSRRTATPCTLRIAKAGSYRVVARSRDSKGQTVEAGFKITASGDQNVAWPRFDHERIELVSDRDSYRPGQTAKLVVQSPFPRARGILTLERGGLIEHRLIEISGNTPEISVPITAGHVPNVFASVVLLRGRVHDKRDASGFETGAPAFRIGYAKLAVEPADRRLAVKVSPAKRVAHPGARVAIDLDVRDAAGKPTAASATVMVVDEAVLGLTGYRTPDPVRQLNAHRPLGVRTASSMLDLPHSQRERHEAIFPPGDGGSGFALSEFSADLRSLFKSTAYWNPKVRIDASGKARVFVKLPDNVTSYRIMAVVKGLAATSGSGAERLTVRKPLMVQPVLPRFVYPGDTLRVEAQLFNGTDAPSTVRVAAGFQGITLSGSGTRTRSARIEPGKNTLVSFPATVSARTAEHVVVRFSARMGKHTDNVEVKIPIHEPGVQRTRVTTQPVIGRGDLAVTFPADRVPGSERLEVMVSSSRLGQLKGAVQYVMGYPNGCIEQTTSTAYPLVVLEDLLPEMGVTVDPKLLKKYATAGVKRLLSFQTSSGGLAYWPGSDDAHAFGTAFGLTALIEAKKRGYKVPATALAKMSTYLLDQLRRGKINGEMPHGGMADADTRALFVMTLGRLGKPQPGYISTLWSKRSHMTAFGLSFLAVAVHEINPKHALLGPMLAEVRSKATKTATEAYYKGKAAGGWSMGSPLRTHATALLAFASAARSNPMAAKLMAGLLGRQQNGMWGNTQENVFGIMAVAKLLSGGSPTAPKMQLAINGASFAAAKLTKVAKGGRVLKLGAKQLKLVAGTASEQSVTLTNGAGTPLYITVRASYDVALNARTRAPRANGFEVRRTYETPNGTAITGKVRLGSLVKVRLRIKAAKKHNYVAIDDKLPAGLEPLNANLVTTQKVSAGKVNAAIARGLAVLSHTEVRDARVAFYANELPAGTYELVYLARATTKGRFLRPAASAEAMYQPQQNGTSSADWVVVQ